MPTFAGGSVLDTWYQPSPRRSEASQILLATRILDQQHETDVDRRIQSIFGARQAVIKDADLSRNALLSYVDRIGRAYHVPPAATGLPEALARLLADRSASTTIERYAAIDARPLPTPVGQASHAAQRYELGVGYGGVLLGWSPRERRVYLRVVSPADLDPEYASDSPMEPTVIRYRGERLIDGRPTMAIHTYDLTDLDQPSYRVRVAQRDVTVEVHGRTYEGEGYYWRDPEGQPYHPLVIRGHDRDPYRLTALVEASLWVAVRWSAWGVGVDHASHPQRNVRGLSPVGADSSSAEGDHGRTGIPVGPETVLQWYDTDPERPGDHWQDAPAYDPEALARAIRVYEQSALSALGIPVDLEGVGGDPAEREAKAVDELMRGTYAECRRFDAELLRRAGWLATTLAEEGIVPAGDYLVGEVGLLYRDEITEALASRAPAGPPPEDEDDPLSEDEE